MLLLANLRVIFLLGYQFLMFNQRQNGAPQGMYVYATHSINQMAYSLAYVKVSTIINQLQLISHQMAQINGNNMQPFVIPKILQPTEEVGSSKKRKKENSEKTN